MPNLTNTFIPLTISAAFLLSACDPGPTIAELCEQNTQTCELFTVDTWCKAERKNILLTQTELNKSLDDRDKYKFLIALENYKKCVSHAAKIEHIKLKEKRTARIQNHEKAEEKIKEISEETKNSKNPYLLYFHWSRYLNKEALTKFIALEGSSELESSELQFFLATYYIKRDTDKTLTLLYHALELYQVDDGLNVEIFKSLSSIFTDRSEYKQAYIWLKILHLYQPDDKDITKDTLSNFIAMYNLDATLLNKVAISTLDKITQGKFIPPKH